jgi:branched-subunit amino acid ABC-type transport system permease component
MAPLTLGLQFNGKVVGPALVSGFTSAGLYALIAVALVLSYRVSRTVAFIHGGLTLMGALLFYWLTAPKFGTETHPQLPKFLGLAIVVALGALIAGVYGLAVTGRRMAAWPRVTLTTFSLAGMLLLAGVLFEVISVEAQQPPSPFGTRSFRLFGQFVSMHQVMTLVIVTAIVAVLSVALKVTRIGIYVRAIADNVEASRLVGVPINQVGTGVFAVSGAVAALGGALLASAVGIDAGGIVSVFLRALIVSVIGGFNSLTLALGGAVLLGVADNSLRSGVFGPLDAGVQEMLVIGVIFAAVVGLNRFRSQGRELLQAEGM